MIKAINKELERFPLFLESSKTRSFPIKIKDKTIFVNRERLALGNIKLVDILIFDLMAGPVEQGGSCTNCAMCWRSCYAKQAQTQYPYARFFRLINMYLLQNNPELLYTLLTEQIQASNKTTLRIHSSGDFLNYTEIKMWDRIIRENPTINFYAYSKVDAKSLKRMDERRDNFNLISSFIEYNGIKYLNFGRPSYVDRIAKKTGAFVCPATVEGNDIKCGKDCSYCVTNKKPMFYFHGQGKTPTLDKDGNNV